MQATTLRNFGREAHLRKKWDKLWREISERVLRLPQREQNIILEDFRTAIQSRILVMERINNANREG